MILLLLFMIVHSMRFGACPLAYGTVGQAHATRAFYQTTVMVTAVVAVAVAA